MGAVDVLNLSLTSLQMGTFGFNCKQPIRIILFHIDQISAINGIV
jgi:hypothetical protein